MAESEMTSAPTEASLLDVITDASDYAPGSTATFTVTGATTGGDVTLDVDHVLAGADGIVGTEDDLLSGDLSGTDPFTVTDGGAGDLDGVANGTVVAQWQVGQDAADQAFVLTATDEASGATATTSFTDSSHTGPVVSDGATLVDLTTSGSSATINGALFVANAFDTVSGTGIFPSFVRVDGNPSSTEQGYNYDNSGGVDAQYDEGNDAPHNHKVLLSDIAIWQDADGKQFYVFALDSNEPNAKGEGLISLDALQIYAATSGSLTDFDAPTQQGGTGTGFGSAAQLVYNLDGAVNSALITDSNAAGSGRPDLAVFVPVADFAGHDPSTTYIYLYSAFGYQGGDYEAGSGFEEWSTPQVAETVGINIEKITGDGPGNLIVDGDGVQIESGSPVTWTYLVTNTGKEALSDVTVTDNIEGAATYVSGDDGDNKLEVGETWVFTKTGTAVSGLYTNTGTASGHYLGFYTSDSDDSSYLGNSVRPPAQVTIDKVTVDGDIADDNITIMSGETIGWTYTVTNTGGRDLNQVEVTDSDTGLTLVLDEDASTGFEDGVLNVGETWVYHAAGASQAGPYENTATVTGHVVGQPDEVTTSDEDSSNYFGAVIDIDVTKYLSVDGGETWFDANDPTGPTLLAGYDDPQYKFEITNSSNVALDINLKDLGIGIDKVINLAAGGSVEEFGDGTWAAGQQTNTADVSSSFTDDAGHTVDPTDSDSANYFGAVIDIDVTKYVSVDGGQTWFDANDPTGPTLLAGYDDPQYKFEITNSSNVALDINLKDLGIGIDKVISLAAGGSAEEFGDGTWAAGQQTNTADVSSIFTDDAGHTVDPTDSDSANYFGVTTGIDVEKFVSLDGGATWLDADTVSGEPTLLTGNNPKFRFVVTNLSNVALENIVLSDDKLDLNGNLSGGNLVISSLAANDHAAGGADTFTIELGGTWERGQHTNTATASASFEDAAHHVSEVTDSDSANYFGADPSISVDKKTNGLDHGLNVFQGQSVTWTYAVKNTGNVELSHVSLTDDKIGTLYLAGDTNKDGLNNNGESWVASGDLDNDGRLDLNETWQYQKSGTAQPGSYTNTATVTGDYTDTGHHTGTATGTDSSDYEGYSNRARTQGFWNNVSDSWDNVANNESNSTKSKVASTELRSLDINPRTDAYLLLGDTNGNGTSDSGENTLLISNALAKSILASSTTGDARVIMLQQAIAAQLNIDNGTPLPNDLVGEAVSWLKGQDGWVGGAKITLDANGAIKVNSNGTLYGSAVATSSDAWTKYVDVSGAHSGNDATGEGLKNALMWYNQGQLVASGNTTSDHIAWYNGSSFLNEQTNSNDNFWLTLSQTAGLAGISHT